MCVSFEGLGQLPSALLDLLVYSIFHSPVLPLTPVGSQNSYQRCGKRALAVPAMIRQGISRFLLQEHRNHCETRKSLP